MAAARAPPTPSHRPALLTTCIQILAIACLGCSTSLLTTLSKRATSGSAYTYSPPAVIITAEFCKAGISLGLVVATMRGKSGATRGGESGLLSPGAPCHAPPRLWLSNSTSLRLAALAALYALQNNLLFAALTQVNLATYQVLISLRIPMTAGLMRVMLGRRFSTWQQGAIWCLTAGAVMSQVDIGRMVAGGGSDASAAPIFALNPRGAAYMATTVACASVASVANETMLKDETAGSLNAQNFVLYACGVLVNVAIVVVSGSGWPGPSPAAFYRGFNAYTWALVCSLTCLGLATAAVLKHADNMVRSLGYVGSIVLASAASAAWLGSALSPSFAAGAAVACAGIVAYMVGPPTQGGLGAVLGQQALSKAQPMALPVTTAAPVKHAWPSMGHKEGEG